MYICRRTKWTFVFCALTLHWLALLPKLSALIPFLKQYQAPWEWWDVVFEVNNQGRDFPKFRSSLPQSRPSFAPLLFCRCLLVLLFLQIRNKRRIGISSFIFWTILNKVYCGKSLEDTSQRSAHLRLDRGLHFVGVSGSIKTWSFLRK